MAAVGELDLLATFDWERFVVHDLPAQYVAHEDLVREGNDDVEATWVKSDGQAFLLEFLGDFMRASLIVPDTHRLVL